jgi:hypothetical protein
MRKKLKEDKYKSVTITLPPEVFNLIKKFSEENYISLSAATRQLVMDSEKVKKNYKIKKS